MTQDSVTTRRWHHVMVTYDGSSSADGIRIYVDGEPQDLLVRHDCLSDSIRTDQPLRIGRRSTSAHFVGIIDDVRIYSRDLSATEVRRLVHTQLAQGILRTSFDRRTKQQRDVLRQHFLAFRAPDHLREIHAAADFARRQAEQLRNSVDHHSHARDGSGP